MEEAAQIMGLKITASPQVAAVKPVCSDLSEKNVLGMEFEIERLERRNAELLAAIAPARGKANS